MTELTKPQVRKLKALAQRLEPHLRIGKHGVTETFLHSFNEALDRCELVKIRFDEFKEQRKVLAPQLAAQSASHFIWMVGHVAVFYRQQPEPARRKITFA